jgi:kynurenine formamidase
LDAPRHFDDRGATLDEFPAEYWRFDQIAVVDVPQQASGLVDVKDVETQVQVDADCILLRTGFEAQRGKDIYWKENPGLSPELGTWIRRHRPNVRIVGLDSISISRWQDRELGRVAHRAFLGEGPGRPVLLCEDMSFSALNGKSRLAEAWFLPLRVSGADGGACTVAGRLA